MRSSSRPANCSRSSPSPISSRAAPSDCGVGGMRRPRPAAAFPCPGGRRRSARAAARSGQAGGAGRTGVSPGELAELYAQRHHIDIRNAERAGFAAPPFRSLHRLHRTAGRGASNSRSRDAKPRRRLAARAISRRPIHINRREVRAVGRHQGGAWELLGMADRRPWQVVCVLAFDQVGPMLSQHRLHRPVPAASGGSGGCPAPWAKRW